MIEKTIWKQFWHAEENFSLVAIVFIEYLNKHIDFFPKFLIKEKKFQVYI